MQIANGARLIAAVPIYAGNDYPREWLIAAERMDIAPGEQFVVTTMDSLDATWWRGGSWYDSEKKVMAAFYLWCGIYDLDRKHLQGLLAE